VQPRADKLVVTGGFTLLELLVVVAVMACLGAIATPLAATFYSSCALKATMSDICLLVREARGLALSSDGAHAVTFNPGTGKACLVAARGPDNKWNTADDQVLRTVKVVGRGGGLRFGYGSCGPIPGLAPSDDGITFQVNNSMVCNQDLSSNAGTVYLVAGNDTAMALTANSSANGYRLRRCNNGKWETL